MAETRFDIQSGVDRFMFVVGRGHMIGLPSRPGESSAVTTGIPTDGIVGFAPGAMFLNYKGAIGSAFYVNTGTNASATWTNVL